VRRISVAHADVFGRLVATAFDYPPALAPIISPTIDQTAEDTVSRDAPSFRNLRRLGFEVAYARPNYLWVRTAAQLTIS
jgi:hypothetical protein